MQVYHDLEACASGPAYSIIHEGQLPLDIWIPRQGSNGPVTDWDANMVQASSCNAVEVILSDPGVPVSVKTVRSFGPAEDLGVCVLVHDSPARGPFFEDRRGDPWLENQPTAEVDTTHFIIVIVER